MTRRSVSFRSVVSSITAHTVHQNPTTLPNQNSLSRQSARPRHATVGRGALVAAGAVTMVLAVSAQTSAATSPGTAFCQAADGTYQTGCRLVQGRPDGWFVPADSEVGTPVVPSNAR
jgi:hypothetical protein